MTAIWAFTAPAQAGTLVQDSEAQTETQSSPPFKTQTRRRAGAKRRMSEQRSAIPGSEERLRAGERWISAAGPDQQVSVTLLLKRSATAPSEEDLLSGKYQAPSREQAEATLRADPAELKAVSDFANQFGMQVLSEDAASRRVRVEATAKQVQEAFGVQLKWASDSHGHRFLTYEGPITVPANVANTVTAVLGLSQRAVARPR